MLVYRMYVYNHSACQQRNIFRKQNLTCLMFCVEAHINMLCGYTQNKDNMIKLVYKTCIYEEWDALQYHIFIIMYFKIFKYIRENVHTILTYWKIYCIVARFSSPPPSAFLSLVPLSSFSSLPLFVNANGFFFPQNKHSPKPVTWSCLSISTEALLRLKAGVEFLQNQAVVHCAVIHSLLPNWDCVFLIFFSYPSMNVSSKTTH